MIKTTYKPTVYNIISAIFLFLFFSGALWFIGDAISETVSVADAYSDYIDNQEHVLLPPDFSFPTGHHPRSYAISPDDDHLFYPTTDDIMEATGNGIY